MGVADSRSCSSFVPHFGEDEEVGRLKSELQQKDQKAHLLQTELLYIKQQLKQLAPHVSTPTDGRGGHVRQQSATVSILESINALKAEHEDLQQQKSDLEGKMKDLGSGNSLTTKGLEKKHEMAMAKHQEQMEKLQSQIIANSQALDKAQTALQEVEKAKEELEAKHKQEIASITEAHEAMWQKLIARQTELQSRLALYEKPDGNNGVRLSPANSPRNKSNSVDEDGVGTEDEFEKRLIAMERLFEQHRQEGSGNLDKQMNELNSEIQAMKAEKANRGRKTPR